MVQQKTANERLVERLRAAQEKEGDTPKLFSFTSLLKKSRELVEPKAAEVTPVK